MSEKKTAEETRADASNAEAARKRDAPAQPPIQSLSIIERARRAEADAESARREAIAEVPQDGSPRALAFHPDGREKMMVISHPDGSSEREVTVTQYEALTRQSAPGTWTVIYTEAVGSHHSSGEL